MNISKIREDFPVLSKKINGMPVVYFDSACMSLRPRQVVEKINQYYNEYPACGGRSMHKLGKRVTEEVQASRKIAQKFFNAKSEKEIVFTKNTTEAINLVAHSFDFKKGDKILTTDKEHNSNLIPWQMLHLQKGIVHQIVMSKNGIFDMEDFKNKIKGCKMVSMVHTSNLDGTTIPAKEIIKIAHENNAVVMLDGAQSAPHKEVDLKKLDVDFFACSGHKMLGPSGIGMLYGKYELLEKLDAFIVGGDTVIDTTYESHQFEKPPEKFEAGLQHYSGIIGLSEAFNYLSKVDKSNISEHEKKLNSIITDELAKNDKIQIIGPKDAGFRSGIFSFNIKGMDPHEIAIMLDRSSNIMIRSGAHCVHSWFNANGLKGSARASLYLYNTEDEAMLFSEKVKEITKFVK